LAAERPFRIGSPRRSPSLRIAHAEVPMLQNYSEREALAREDVRKVKKNAAALFTKEFNQRNYRAYMERESIERLVELARAGDKDAVEFLLNRGRVARSLGVTIPTCFHEFVWEWFLDGPPKASPGSSPKDTGLKHLTIALLVKLVSKDHGFPEYGGPDQRGDPNAPMTACRLVAEELGLSESWVIRIWDEYKEIVLRKTH
jgi:hypothetical protein